MNIIDVIKEKAKSKSTKIVLPESMDSRVLEAALIASKEKICEVIVLGDKNDIPENLKNDYSNITFINPLNSEFTNSFIDKLYELRKDKGLTYDEAKRLILEDYMYYACMLVKEGYADGIVSGACHSSSNTLRPALQIIKAAPDSSLVSSFFLVSVPNCKYGYDGNFIFADCGLVQNPNSEELANIAYSSAKSFELLLHDTPYVALLSHSTKGSAKHDDVSKVCEAVEIAKDKFSNYKIDGEFQLDAAIDPEVAKIKGAFGDVAGRANVLVFPDLDAGNIGYKLVQRLGNASAYGPITQGIASPVNDLSRGCSVEDIVGAIAITAVQAQNKKIHR